MSTISVSDVFISATEGHQHEELPWEDHPLGHRDAKKRDNAITFTDEQRDPASGNPTQAWDIIRLRQVFQPKASFLAPASEDGANGGGGAVSSAAPSSPGAGRPFRVVCISDTHAREQRMPGGGAARLPDGDLLLHAGDVSNRGGRQEVLAFLEWFRGHPHRWKVWIAGNHDLGLDPLKAPDGGAAGEEGPGGRGATALEREIYSLLEQDEHCFYLHDEAVRIPVAAPAGTGESGGERCLTVYGSPYQPEFMDWGFNLDRGGPCRRAWAKIPADTDVLVTHGPPLGRGDLCSSKLRAGCLDLLEEVQQRVKPALHVFGHIHEGYGASSDGTTLYVNAATCNLAYRPQQPPVVVDLLV